MEKAVVPFLFGAASITRMETAFFIGHPFSGEACEKPVRDPLQRVTRKRGDRRFMDALNEVISRADSFVWNNILLFVLVGTGIFFTIRTRFVQIRRVHGSVCSGISRSTAERAGRKV